MSSLIFNCFGCEPVSPGFILPFCKHKPVQADAGLPVWSSLPTELEYNFSLPNRLFFMLASVKKSHFIIVTP
jgi:hypothetical protein